MNVMDVIMTSPKGKGIATKGETECRKFIQSLAIHSAVFFPAVGKNYGQKLFHHGDLDICISFQLNFAPAFEFLYQNFETDPYLGDLHHVIMLTNCWGGSFLLSNNAMWEGQF